jgi:large subunit ribosomal protein L7Ae
LFEKDARNYRTGRDIQPKRDLSRFVKWPRYVRLQRQRAVLKKRLKVPPSINQFTRVIDKNNADTLFRLLAKYRPESKEAKKKRLQEAAKKRHDEEKAAKDAKKDAKDAKDAKDVKKDAKGDAKDDKKKSDKPLLLKYGINHVTTLVETRKAKLVVIAHDVDPIELVVWLPALCRKKEVPFCIVKGKARLGRLVHKKTATAVAITEVKQEDHSKLEQLIQSCKLNFNDDINALRKWGGGQLGSKATAVIRAREKAAQREAQKRMEK